MQYPHAEMRSLDKRNPENAWPDSSQDAIAVKE
jgi:hypothetical protein